MPLVLIHAQAPWGPVSLKTAADMAELLARLQSTPGSAPAHVEDVGERDPADVVREALRLLPPPMDATGQIPATVEKARITVVEAVARVSAVVATGPTEAVSGKPVSHGGPIASDGMAEAVSETQVDAGMNANECGGGAIAGSPQSNPRATFGNVGQSFCRAPMMTNDDICIPPRRSGAEVDAKAIRAALGLSQPAFAKAFGIPLPTLRDWEQGRSRPEGPGRTLLAVIEAHPNAVRQAVEGTGSQ